MSWKDLRKDHNCKGRRKDGKPCRAPAMEGGLCFFHANPNKAAELGRVGGLTNRCAAREFDPLPPLDGFSNFNALLDRVISELYAGQLKPRVAAALGPLLNARMRVMESNLEKRVAQLERARRAETAVSPESNQPMESQEGGGHNRN